MRKCTKAAYYLPLATILAGLCLLSLGGCPRPDDGGDGNTTVSLIVTVTPQDGGSVVVTPQQAAYYASDTISITATASAGYRFDHWAGGASGSTNPLSLTLAGNTAIQAVFVLQSTVQPELSDAVTVLPGTVQVKALTGGQVELSGSGVPALVPGQVLVSGSSGIVGRVVSFRTVAGATTVVTTPACLTDIVKKAHIEINTGSTTLTAARWIPARTGSIVRAADISIENGVVTLDLSGTELEISDVCKITLANGSFQFDPDFDFVLDIDDFSISRFKLAAAGTININMDLQAEIFKTAGLMKKEVTLGEAEFARGIVPIGPIPLEYVFFAKIKLGAEAECGELGTISGGVDVTAGVQAGAEYANGGWTPIGNFTFGATPHVPAMDIWPVKVKVYAEPEVGVKFFELAGPSISFKDYVQLQSDKLGNREHVGAELRKGSEVNLNFEFKVPKLDFAKLTYTKTLYDSSYVMLGRLAFAADPTSMGTIDWSPTGWGGSNWFWYTSPVTVTGTANSGGRLAAYGIDYLCKDTSVMRSGEFALQSEPIDGSKLITAYFVPLNDGDDWPGSGGVQTGPYTLTTECFPADSGSIVVFPNRTGYKKGAHLLVEARPDSGSRFHHWEGALSGTDVVQQFTIGSSNVTIRAVFESIVPRLLKVPQDYGTIQAAIDAATYGDQINLDFGTYKGTGNRDLLFKGKYLSIHGASQEETIIDLEGSSTTPYRLTELWDVAGTVSFTNLTVRNGYAGNSAHVGNPNFVGGAIMLSEQSSAYIGWCKFVNCRAGGDGGAIWYDDPSTSRETRLIVTASRFETCSASSDGGAIAVRNYTAGPASVSISNSTFVSNTAASQGGAIYCPEFRGPVDVLNCTFTSNIANSQGGAIRMGRVTGMGQVQECTFNTNRSESMAGALYGEANLLGKGGTFMVSNCTFTGNSSKGLAGAVFTTTPGAPSPGEALILEFCQFTGNSSAHGGALSLGASTSMRNCTFQQNTASSDAGAAIVAGQVSDCSFTSNAAGVGTTVTSDAGAVELRPGGILDNCTFTSNSCTLWGGAVWIASRQTSDPVAIVSGCEFRSNTAKGGGAIKADSGTIRNCPVITGNVATLYQGGGIKARNAEISNCVVFENQALQGNGGGMSLDTCTVTDCHIVENVSGENGGGIQDIYSTLSFCTVFDNTAVNGGGIYCNDTEVLSSALDGNIPNNCACGTNETCCQGF